MSEKPQNFEIPEEDGVVIREDIVPAQDAAGERKEGEVPEEVHLAQEGAAEKNSDESFVSIEEGELSPETKEAVEAFSALSAEEQNVLAETSEGLEALVMEKSGIESRAEAVAIGFNFEESKGDSPAADLLKKFMNGSLRVVRQTATGAIVALAAFSHSDNAEAGGFVDYIPMIAGVAGVHNPSTGRQIERSVIYPAQRQMQGQQRMEAIAQQQHTLEMRYAKIEREKEELLLRAAGNSRIAGIEASVESRVRPMEIDARYEAGKAQLKASRAQLRATYLSKPNPTEVDQAQYEAQIAQLNEREVRLDAQYQMNRVRDEVGRETKNMRAAHGVADVYDQIERKNMEQERIRTQIQKLNMDRATTQYSTSRDVARGVFRGR